MRTILVVEDEPQIAGLVRDYLEHAGLRRDRGGRRRAPRLPLPVPVGPMPSSWTWGCRAWTAST